MLKKKIIINFDSENMLIAENDVIVKFIPSAVIRKKSEAPIPTAYGNEAFKKRHSLSDNEVYCTPFSNGKIIASGSPKELFKNHELIKKSKIDHPFIYKVSSKIDWMSPTYDIDEFLENLWK